MKSKLSLLSFLVILLFAGGCTKREKFNINFTAEPAEGYFAESLEDFDSAAVIIKRRLLNTGIKDENIRMENAGNGILVYISGADTSDLELIKAIVTTPGKLEFWETWENKEFMEYLVAANDKLKNIDISHLVPPATSPAPEPPAESDIPGLIGQDSASSAQMKEFKIQNPLFSVLNPMINSEGEPMPSCLIGLSKLSDTATVMRLLELDEVSFQFPRNVRFYWSRDPYDYDQTQTFYELHAIKLTSISRRAPLDASVIATAKPVVDKSGINPVLQIAMNAEGARIWSRMTKENIDRCIAVIMDGYVRVYPRVATEITNGRSEITGAFSLDEIKCIACILNNFGKPLPFPMKITELQVTAKQ